MNRRSFAKAIALLSLALPTFHACRSGPLGGSPPPPAPPPPPPPGDVNFRIGDDFFEDPDGDRNADAVVTITLGQSVGWRNDGNLLHTVTSTSAPGGDDFDSGNLSPGATFLFTPNQAGTYIFRCDIHPNTMLNSRIIVNQP